MYPDHNTIGKHNRCITLKQTTENGWGLVTLIAQSTARATQHHTNDDEHKQKNEHKHGGAKAKPKYIIQYQETP